MKCKFCSAELNPESKFCPQCGAENLPSTQPENNAPQAPLFNLGDDNRAVYDTQMRSPENAGKMSLSVIFGALAIVLSLMNYFGVMFVHMVGIVVGALAIRLAQNDKRNGKALSTLGLVLGIIGLGLGALAFVIGFIGGILSAA